MVVWSHPIEVIKVCIAEAIQDSFIDINVSIDEIIVDVSKPNNNVGADYQSGIGFKVARLVPGGAPLTMAETIAETCNRLNSSSKYALWTASAPGFVNAKIHENIKLMLADQLFKRFGDSHNLGMVDSKDIKRVVVDFSSPNLMKPMHVGHLRSTVIGDVLANLYENCGHEVMRISHVGDFGAQFGVLLAYIEEKNIDVSGENIYSIMNLYKKSKSWEKERASHKDASRKALARLQKLDSDIVGIWNDICKKARENNKEIYTKLKVSVLERGESFYRSFMKQMVDNLENEGLITISDGAKCVFLDGFYNQDGSALPVIVQKSDGAFNYTTADIAAFYYRVQYDKADKILYVADEGQKQHFAMLFDLVKAVGLCSTNVECAHVDFGVVLSQEGKRLKTREGDPPLLEALISDAIEYARNHIGDHLDNTGKPMVSERHVEAIAVNAIKFSDLIAQRGSSYVYSLDKMLGKNSGIIQIMYSFARLNGIIRASGINKEDYYLHKKWPHDFESSHIRMSAAEIDLLFVLIRTPELLFAAMSSNSPHVIAHHLFDMSSKFRHFFSTCRVIGHDAQDFRILLCEFTRRVFKGCGDILGLELLDVL